MDDWVGKNPKAGWPLIRLPKCFSRPWVVIPANFMTTQSGETPNCCDSLIVKAAASTVDSHLPRMAAVSLKGKRAGLVRARLINEASLIVSEIDGWSELPAKAEMAG